MLLDRLKHFFKEDYLELSQSIMPPERTEAETKQIVKWLGLPRGSTILDLGCGHGRLTIPLAREGYEVTGLDYSEESLRQAAIAAESSGLQEKVQFIHGLMKDLNMESGFDAVINIGTAMGYLEEKEDERSFRRVYEALKPGGKLLIETENRDFKVHSFTSRRWDDMAGMPVWSQRVFYPDIGRWVETIRWLKKEKIRSAVLDIRLYSPTEVRRMLEDIGFADVAVFGGLERCPLELTSPRMVVSAVKPAMQ